MADLLLTLGHNSSAIVADGDTLLAGYETERISKAKSDSRFPHVVIDRLSSFGYDKFENIFVTHWEPFGKVDQMSAKHWDRAACEKVGARIIAQEDHELTHHDTHAYAALAFAGPDFPSYKTNVLVVDGFGTASEHLTMYEVLGPRNVKVKTRIFGYETSIGLMYQYATNFLGMKMHEDEYKLLGYQSRLDILSDYQIEALDRFVLAQHQAWISATNGYPKGISPALTSLPGIMGQWADTFCNLLNALSISNAHGLEARVAVAHAVQSLTELNVLHVVKTYSPDNLIVSGGVFMNVGLNAALAKAVPGQFCAYPLAGDQGNAIGLRFAALGLRGNSDLRIGHRMSISLYANDLELPPGFLIAQDEAEMSEMAMQALESFEYVNIVRGAMEFGPRALCNTSTIAVANKLSVVREINRVNGRNTVMPFAPVMKSCAFDKYFDLGSKIWKSEEFMITALDCNHMWHYDGAALETYDGRQTARPQVLRNPDAVMDPLLNQYEVLINTSFNTHGTPIVLDLEDAIKCHKHQLSHSQNVVTIYLD
jgi:predicted NodU family carbamoyl transferase